MEEETIYKLIVPDVVQLRKKMMYHSSFPGVFPPTASTFKNNTTANNVNNIAGSFFVEPSSHKFESVSATFGKMRMIPRLRSQLLEPLKKNTNITESWSKSSLQRSLSPIGKMKLKPIVPKHTERPLMGLKSSRNFIVLNAVESILFEPKKKPSEIQWTQKSDYGKVPEYLNQIKGAIQDEYNLAQSIVFEDQHHQEQQKYLLNPEEIQNLRDGLKAKWNEVNSKYQLISHIQNIDTVGLRRKKLGFENQLDQLEKDLERLNKNYIFVDKSH